MDFELSEEQSILRESVRNFAEKEIKPIAEELDKKEEFSIDLVHRMAEMGLFGMFVPEEYGGSNMGYIS
ncbi:acyl-CoA dehydrogenase, partial [bacterium]